MTRKIAYNEEQKPADPDKAKVRFAFINIPVIFADLGVLLYLYTDLFQGLGIPKHNLSDEKVMTYAISATVIMLVLSAVLYYFTVWPAIREARNAK